MALAQGESGVAVDTCFTGDLLCGTKRAAALSAVVKLVPTEGPLLKFQFGNSSEKSVETFKVGGSILSVINADIPLVCGQEFIQKHLIGIKPKTSDGTIFGPPSVEISSSGRKLKSSFIGGLPHTDLKQIVVLMSTIDRPPGDQDLETPPPTPPPTEPPSPAKVSNGNNSKTLAPLPQNVTKNSMPGYTFSEAADFEAENVTKLHKTAHSSRSKMYKLLKSTRSNWISSDLVVLHEVCDFVVNNCVDCGKFGKTVVPGTALRLPPNKNARMHLDVMTLDFKLDFKALIGVDEGTRDCFAVTIKSTSAKDIFHAFVLNWCVIHGPPSVVFADGDGGFASPEFEAELNTLGCHRLPTPAYSAASHGLVERMILSFRECTDKMSGGDRAPASSRDWDLSLGVIANAIRNEVIVGGHTASERSMGSKTHLLKSFLNSKDEHSNFSSSNTHVQNLIQKSNAAFHAVNTSLKIKAKLKERSRPTFFRENFRVGEFVRFYRKPKSGRGATWSNAQIIGIHSGSDEKLVSFFTLARDGQIYRAESKNVEKLAVDDVPADLDPAAELFNADGTFKYAGSKDGGQWSVPPPLPTTTVDPVVAVAPVSPPKPALFVSKTDVSKANGSSNDGLNDVSSGGVKFFPPKYVPKTNDGPNDVLRRTSKITNPNFDTYDVPKNVAEFRTILLADYANHKFTTSPEEDAKIDEIAFLAHTNGGETPEPDAEPECIGSGMDAYAYSFDELPEEVRKAARKEAISDYDRFGSWDRSSDITDAQLEVFLFANPEASAIDYAMVDKAKFVNGVLSGKCRIAPRGFKDHMRYSTPVQSPTCSEFVFRVYTVLAMREGWTAFSGDVSKAFFQIAELLSRVVFLKIPDDDLDPKHPDLRWRRLLKAVPGMNEATRLWFNTFKDWLISVGFVQSKYESALFLHKKAEAVEGECPYDGMLPLHVDDFLGRGSPEFVAWFEVAIKSKFEMGLFEIVSLHKTVEFRGTEFTETEEGLVVSQSKYLSSKLKSCAVDSNPKTFLSNFRGSLGTARWVVDHSQYVELYDISKAAQKVNCLTEPDAKILNDSISLMKSEPLTVLLPKLSKLYPPKLVGLADAGMADRDVWVNGQLGFAIGVANDAPASETNTKILKAFAAVEVKSQKLRRVANGSFDAETLAGVRCVTALLIGQLLIKEFYHGVSPTLASRVETLASEGLDSLDENLEEDALRGLCQIELHTDSDGLVRHVNSQLANTRLEQRRAEDVASIRECRAFNRLLVIHINGVTNPTDCLTKGRARSQATRAILRKLLSSGEYLADFSEKRTEEVAVKPKKFYGKKKA